MSQNFSLREPKFCFCLPLAKGVCCGFISLKIALFLIAALDITIGGAALGIGIMAFFKMKLNLSLAAYAIINTVSLVLAFGCLYAIAKQNIKVLKFYFWWKSVEIVIVPIFEIIILVTST